MIFCWSSSDEMQTWRSSDPDSKTPCHSYLRECAMCAWLQSLLRTFLIFGIFHTWNTKPKLILLIHIQRMICDNACLWAWASANFLNLVYEIAKKSQRRWKSKCYWNACDYNEPRSYRLRGSWCTLKYSCYIAYLVSRQIFNTPLTTKAGKITWRLCSRRYNASRKVSSFNYGTLISYKFRVTI